MAEPPPQPLQRTVSKDDLPFNLLDDMFEAASQANPPLASIAELPDNALVNMLLSPAMADDNVREACERQLAQRESLRLPMLSVAGAGALSATVSSPRGSRFTRRFAGLRSLSVRDSRGLEDAGLTALAGALPPTLAELDIGGTACTDAGMIAIAAVLPSTSLKALDVRSNPGVDTAGWTALSEALRELPALRTLNCSCCGPLNRPSARETRAAWVARCARDTAGMGSAGASVLAASLPSIPGLESVYLDQCGIGDEGARALAAVMPQCPSLLRLYIFSNPIGPAGKSALEAAIPECPKLTDTYKEAFFREEPCQVVT